MGVKSAALTADNTQEEAGVPSLLEGKKLLVCKEGYVLALLRNGSCRVPDPTQGQI